MVTLAMERNDEGIEGAILQGDITPTSPEKDKGTLEAPESSTREILGN